MGSYRPEVKRVDCTMFHDLEDKALKLDLKDLHNRVYDHPPPFSPLLSVGPNGVVFSASGSSRASTEALGACNLGFIRDM